MSTTIALRNTKISAIEETTPGTPQAETAASAFFLNEDGIEFNIDRELVENMAMTGSLTEKAPQPGMYSEDLGFSTTINMRGKGTLTKPEWSVFIKSIMGKEEANTDGVVGLGATTSTIPIKSGGADIEIGQQVYFPTQLEISRVITATVSELTIFPPLLTAPSEDDTFVAGINWMLTSDDHPSFTAYSYFESVRRLRLAGCKTVNWECNFEVGQIATMAYTVKALSPTYDCVAQSVTPIYDDVTQPLMCLGITSKTILSSVATGTPTTTETILTAPNFQVLENDTMTIDVGAGVYETVTISNVSGNECENQTLTHAAVSVAASSGDTVYVTHNQCAYTKDTLTISVEIEDEAEKCMVSSSGFSGRSFTKRKVMLSRTPYFRTWQEFLMRDNVIGSAVWVTLKGTQNNNIVSFHIPNQITTEASLTADALMAVDVTSQGVKDAVLGNDHEISVAAF